MGLFKAQASLIWYALPFHDTSLSHSMQNFQHLLLQTAFMASLVKKLCNNTDGHISLMLYNLGARAGDERMLVSVGYSYGLALGL